MKLKLLFLFVGLNLLSMAQNYSLPKLKYEYGALEPSIDVITMEIHYSKHHQAYITNLNKALVANKLENTSLEDLLLNAGTNPDIIRNNAGGHYNHSLFWEILTPIQNTQPSPLLLKAIETNFTSLDSLKKLITAAASTRFGSGWAWLVVTPDHKLAVTSTANQDNPLMDICPIKGIPILGIDVWEHAYYLKYQNKRVDYLAALWNVVNWTEVSNRYKAALPKPDKFANWPEIKAFHKVMSQTFHPSEEGNLQPIKERSAEMAEKATTLKTTQIPTPFNKKEIIAAINTLAKDSKALDKLVKSKATDDKIIKALNDLHDVFHTIVGLCSHDSE